MAAQDQQTRRRTEDGFIIPAIIVVVAVVIIWIVVSGNKPQTASTTPPPSSIPRSDTVSKMQSIHKQLAASWQVCQIDPSKCQASVAQIASADDVFSSASSQYTGKALDDLTGWKQNIGLAEGDMKQWAINAIFHKDNSLLSSTVPSEIQTDQETIVSFTNDK